MSWELQDADGNRQGLTIAELGELGGPGMGGCPAGPADAVAPKPGTGVRRALLGQDRGAGQLGAGGRGTRRDAP